MDLKAREDFLTSAPSWTIRNPGTLPTAGSPDTRPARQRSPNLRTDSPGRCYAALRRNWRSQLVIVTIPLLTTRSCASMVKWGD